MFSVDHPFEHRARGVCRSCLGALGGSALDGLTSQLTQTIQSRHSHGDEGVNRRICISVTTPAIIDVARLTSRTLISGNARKTFAFPLLSTIVEQILKIRLTAAWRRTADGMKIPQILLASASASSSQRDEDILELEVGGMGDSLQGRQASRTRILMLFKLSFFFAFCFPLGFAQIRITAAMGVDPYSIARVYSTEEDAIAREQRKRKFPATSKRNLKLWLPCS
jgi:hypothetical protein